MQLRRLTLGFILLLAACGSGEAPVYQSSSYVPPATPGGRLCVNQCAQSRDFCHQSCDYDNRACYYEVQKAAQIQYDAYMREQFEKHLPANLLPSDFEHPESCQNVQKDCLADCEKPYNECFRSCGGSINTVTSCQFMCFQ